MDIYSEHKPNKIIFWSIVIIGLFFIGMNIIGFENWMKYGEKPIVELFSGDNYDNDTSDETTPMNILWYIPVVILGVLFLPLTGSITVFILSFVTWGIFILIGKFDKELNIIVSDNQIDESINDIIIRTVILTVFSVLIMFSL